MGNLLFFVTVGLCLILLFNTLLFNRIILTPVFSASDNITAAERAGERAAQVGANITQAKTALQQQAFSGVIGASIIAIALIIVAPLIVNMILTFIQAYSKGINVLPLPTHQLYRLLVAIGVIFTVILIIVYLNSLIWFGAVSPAIISSLLETQKSFVTIIGTAFASLVAFYFGTRGGTAPGTRQASNGGGGTTPGTGESGQKVLQCIQVSPINDSVGVEIDSQVKATFSAPVRTSDISSKETFSVKDENGNAVKGNLTADETYKIITFTPLLPFEPGKTYTVTVKKSIMDISGATMAADKVWSFTTKQ